MYSSFLKLLRDLIHRSRVALQRGDTLYHYVNVTLLFDEALGDLASLAIAVHDGCEAALGGDEAIA